jgi:hypothetical protein
MRARVTPPLGRLRLILHTGQLPAVDPPLMETVLRGQSMAALSNACAALVRPQRLTHGAELGSVASHKLILGYPLRTFVEVRERNIDVWTPPVELTRAGTNERDFIFHPEQDPFAPIFADGDLVHIVSAIDLNYTLARHLMALEVLQGNFGEALRLRISR